MKDVPPGGGRVLDCMTRHAATPQYHGAKLLSGSVAQIPHSRRRHDGSRTHLKKRCPFRWTLREIGLPVPVSSQTASS
ncbi:MAG: hypothetical protein OXD45_09720 [Rhodobacteraceae bacterium]|nr:hypothetical protein [Paracoccaceae bacterium]